MSFLRKQEASRYNDLVSSLTKSTLGRTWPRVIVMSEREISQ